MDNFAWKCRLETPAEMARRRLLDVVAADRKACGDGKWVRRPSPANFLPPGGGYMSHFRGEPITVHTADEVSKFFRPRYRWVPRR